MTDVDEPRNEQEGERATVADMKNQCYICIWPLTERLLNVYCNTMEGGGGEGWGVVWAYNGRKFTVYSIRLIC